MPPPATCIRTTRLSGWGRIRYGPSVPTRWIGTPWSLTCGSKGVTTVVLESTDVYWVPLFALLASRGFEVLLIEPSQARHCGARPRRPWPIDNGCTGCTPMVCCGRRFDHPRRCWRCVVSGGSGRCRCVTQPATSSTSKRPWSRCMSSSPQSPPLAWA